MLVYCTLSLALYQLKVMRYDTIYRVLIKRQRERESGHRGVSQRENNSEHSIEYLVMLLINS